MTFLGGQMVTCSAPGCGKHYRCTPMNDYYNATTAEDGVCETCLMLAAGVHPDRIIYAVAEPEHVTPEEER